MESLATLWRRLQALVGGNDRDLDDELACMALICSLPKEYSHFTSSLLLLDTLDRNKLQSAFMTEELNRTPCPDLLSSQDSANALKAQSSSICTADVQQQRPRNSLHCDYCGKDGHSSTRCFKRMDTLLANSGPLSQANIASQSSSQLRHPQDHWTSSSGVEEFAGSASLHSSLSYAPSQLPADLLWCADTGATAHMTPHHHWFSSYHHHRVPVHLADSTIVYSAGIGCIEFVPELEGKRRAPCGVL